MIEARINLRPVRSLQVAVGQAAGPTGAFRDVIAGQLDVHAAEIGTHVCMDAEGQVELFEDVLEAPRLQPAGAGLGVAVHGITYPQHAVAGGPDSLDRAWQGVLDILRAKAV